MFSIVSLSELLQEITGKEIFSCSFPNYEKGTFHKMEITSGILESGGLLDFAVQIMTKAEHPKQAESDSIFFINKLNMVTDKTFQNDEYQLVLCRCSNPQPVYEGETENGEFVFSADFNLLVTEI